MKWPIAVFAAFALGCLPGCSSSGVAEEENSQDVAETNLVKFDNTTVPIINREREVEWTAYIISRINDSYKTSARLSDFDIALLLEVTRHDEDILFESVSLFEARVLAQERTTFNRMLEMYTLELIADTKLATPHDHSPGRVSLMHPLSIEEGHIVFLKSLHFTKGGNWSGPFILGNLTGPFTARKYSDDPDARESEFYESTPYLMNKKLYGERKLVDFSSQFLASDVRARVWSRFEAAVEAENNQAHSL